MDSCWERGASEPPGSRWVADGVHAERRAATCSQAGKEAELFMGKVAKPSSAPLRPQWCCSAVQSEGREACDYLRGIPTPPGQEEVINQPSSDTGLSDRSAGQTGRFDVC